ncbi:hypothetical protein ACFLTP_08935 [Chloroflexota bacterium]
MKYFGIKRKGKLYRQWVEHAGLPAEATPDKADKTEGIPIQIHKAEAVSSEGYEPPRVHSESDSGVVTHPDVTGDMMAEINRRQPHLPIPYILLGFSLVVLCVGLILLVVQSC